MQTSQIHYVYAYLDTRRPGTYSYGSCSFDCEPFYIGEGKKGRMFDHLKEVERGRHRNKAKCRKITAIVNAGLQPRVVVIKTFNSRAEAQHCEVILISEIGTINTRTGPLTNISIGGDGGDTFTNNPKREKIRAEMKLRRGERNPMYGHKHSEESKTLMSVRRRGIGKGRPPWNKGKKTPERTLRKQRARTGERCPTSKLFVLTAPDGTKHRARGSLRKFCKEHKLAHSFTRYSIGKGSIAHPQREGSIERKNLAGWSIVDCGYLRDEHRVAAGRPGLEYRESKE